MGVILEVITIVAELTDIGECWVWLIKDNSRAAYSIDLISKLKK
jgi:hypothetical protein